jgi:hypothetical protein
MFTKERKEKKKKKKPNISKKSTKQKPLSNSNLRWAPFVMFENSMFFHMCENPVQPSKMAMSLPRKQFS